MWVQVLQAMTYGFAAAVQPGPFTIYLISETARTGWRRTFPAIFAPLLSDGPIAILMVFLLSRAPIRFVQLLSLPGGIYVLYLAVGAWKARAAMGGSGASANRTFFKAAFVNILNPNVYLGWGLILGPLLLSAWREAPGHGVAVVLTFYMTMIACLGALVLLIHAAGSRIPRLNRAVIAVSALALAAFGFYLLAQSVVTMLDIPLF